MGYRKGAKGGVWFIRKLQDGRYLKRKLGIADDRQDANDHDVLSYQQAHMKAIAFTQKQTDAEHGQDYTVAQAMHDYLEWHRVHSRSRWSPNVRFHPKRSFDFSKIARLDRLLSARSRHG